MTVGEDEHLINTTKTGIVPRLAVLFADSAFEPPVTCEEADLIAEFLVKVAGEPDAAARWLVKHAVHDEGPDKGESEQHYGLDLRGAKAWALSL